MRRTLLWVVLALGCRVPDPATPPRAHIEPAERPTSARGIARCSEGGRVEALGAPLSDDLSGLVADGDLLWTHTDARRRRPTIYALRADAADEAAVTLTMSGSVVDPEDLARTEGVTYLADTGDNAGPPRCIRYANEGGTCTLVEVLDLEEESACLAEASTVWVRRTIAEDREPYRIHALALDAAAASLRTLARLEWSRYPPDRCDDPQCRLQAPEALLGHFDAEALFARREPTADGSMGTSLYVVTKAPFPLGALVRLQRRESCRFEHESRALVFRIAGADTVHGDVDVADRIERVAELDLAVEDALEAQITGAALAEDDLVLLSRGRTLRWHVPAALARIDQSFFDAHLPCVAASPSLEDAPKLEAIALGPLADGLRTWYLVSEEGDFARDGSEALFRVSERWSYDGAR